MICLVDICILPHLLFLDEDSQSRALDTNSLTEIFPFIGKIQSEEMITPTKEAGDKELFRYSIISKPMSFPGKYNECEWYVPKNRYLKVHCFDFYWKSYNTFLPSTREVFISL